MHSRWSLLLCAKHNGLLSVQVAISRHYHKVLRHWTWKTVLQLNSLIGREGESIHYKSKASQKYLTGRECTTSHDIVSLWRPTQTQNFIRSPTAAPVQTANQHPLSGQYGSHMYTQAGWHATVWCEYYHITIALDRSRVAITDWLDTAHQFSQWPCWGNSFIPQN